MTATESSVAIVGTGIIGIASAYYLWKNHGIQDIVLIDQGQPMGFTSTQSGDNYRNWWPSTLMMDLTNRSIDLMEQLADETGNRFAMTRRGYILATRQPNMQPILDQLTACLGDKSDSEIRYHDRNSKSYFPPVNADWKEAPDGFDLLSDPALIRGCFPSLDSDVKTILHIRRGGDISGQQLGQVMLERLQRAGIRRVTGMVSGISQDKGFVIQLNTVDEATTIRAERIVNAAGPFAGEIAAMLDVSLPLYNVMQQKIAFPDTKAAIPRDLPFTIDMDRQSIDWDAEDRALLAEDPSTAHLAAEMSGAIHCRPEGGMNGNWLKLGWAYNETAQPADWTIPLDPRFPEIVLRGAARLNPGLKAYYGRLPRQMSHYGGWYTRTRDNWPLIGPMGPEGAFMACGLSGHGTMAACATGELLASWLAGAALPGYAQPFSMKRFTESSLRQTAELETGLL